MIRRKPIKPIHEWTPSPIPNLASVGVEAWLMPKKTESASSVGNVEEKNDKAGQMLLKWGKLSAKKMSQLTKRP
jgi:hypothetical protein